jgi:hypothetical protein
MSTMNNRRIPKLRINEKMIQGIHWEIYKSKTGGTGSMKGCVMMSIDFAPSGGLVDEEIRAIKDYVVQDATNDYYAIGLETNGLVNKGTGDLARHMHIRLVKSEPTTVAKQKLVFHPFLAEGRCVWVDKKGKKTDDKTKKCISLNIDVCEKKYRPTQTPIKQMAYAMKESMGEYNNGITHWSNLLEDYDGSAQWVEDKSILDATVNKSKKKKEQRRECRISRDAQNPMAKKYARLNGLEWSMDNHLEILATMLTDVTGSKEYTLNNDYGLKPKMREVLGRYCGEDNYKEMYLKALQQHAASLPNLCGGISTKQGKKLARENAKWQKKVAKLENICKGHVVTIRNYKRKAKGLSALQDQTKTSTFMVNIAPQDGDICCVCKRDTGLGINGFPDRVIEIRPCNHKYCRACIETQLDKNTINCGHCNINAIENGIRLKEHWCPEFKAQMEFHRGIEHARWIDGRGAKRQKTESSD